MKLIIAPLLAAVLAATSLAQSPQFVLSSRDRAQLLAIDFVATDRDGAVITDLAPKDITVRLGGRARQVLALEFVPTGPGRDRTTDHPLPFGDNSEPQTPRSIVVMVDQDTIRPGRTVQVRDAVRQLLAGLGPDDRVALVSVPFGGLAVDLTRNHRRIISAMADLSAQGARVETAEDAQCRTMTTLQAMTDTLLRLSVVEDPVTVVFFSNQQAGPQQTIRMTGRGAVGGACDLRAATFTDLGKAAARARAHFFVIHSDIDQRGSGLDGLEHITGVTGGPMLHLSTGDGKAAITRVLSETAGHYVARVARDPSDRVNDDVGVSVSSARPGVTVHRAPRFVVTAPASAAPAPASLSDLLRQGSLARDLPLRITGHAFRDDDPARVRLAVTLDSPEVSSTLSSAMIGVFDERGQLVAGIEMSSEALQRRPLVAALSVPPGSYRLKAAALESSGRGGTAEQLIDASLTAIGPLHASAVMIGLSREGGFVPALEFSSEPTAFGMLELYGAVSPAPRVVFEIAHTTMGPALLTMLGLVESSPVPTRAVATAVLPISHLAPGDYVVRVTVTPDGLPGGRVVRTLRKIGVQPVKESAY